VRQPNETQDRKGRRDLEAKVRLEVHTAKIRRRCEVKLPLPGDLSTATRGRESISGQGK